MTRESSALSQVWNRVTSMPSSQNRELNSGAFAAALEEVPRTISPRKLLRWACFLLWTVILLSREILSPLLGAGSVIKTVQQQKQRQGGGARLEARPKRHFEWFFIFFVLRKRDREDGDGEEYKGARD